MKNNLFKKGFTGFIMFFALFLYRAVNWANMNFEGLNIEQMIFHLKVPLEGTDENIIYSFILYTIVPSLIITILIFMIKSFFDSRRTKIFLNLVLNKWKNTKKHFKLNVFPGIASLSIINIVSVILIVIALMNTNKYFGLVKYVKGQIDQSNFIEKEYVAPGDNIEFPKEKRNLIYIYLESIENTFGLVENGGFYEDDIMPELTEIARENYTFSHNSSLLGGNPTLSGINYTIGAMFSHSTGLPLKLPVSGNRMGEFDLFIPGAVSIGEILKEEGYENYLMIGSDAVFGGRNNLYKQHGDYEILDYNRAKEDGIIPSDYEVWWGFEDLKLYSWAKDYLTDISKKDEPFNFTMLTVDTHHAEGYVCDLCQNDYEDQYSNVIACASRQLDEFLNWIKEQDFYENTTIVIAGDHPTMDKKSMEKVPENFTRTTYNTFINPDVGSKEVRLKNRDFYSFDFFPTTLSSLGAKIENERLGLGTNLFSNEDTLFEKYGEKMGEELSKKSVFYRNTFLYPKNK